MPVRSGVPVPGAVLAYFDLVLQTSGRLHPGGGPDDFLSTHTGVIRCSQDEGSQVTAVGKVQAYRIHTDLAAQAGEPLFDVCDAHSRHLREVYAALFDPSTDELPDEVRAQIDGFASDVLVLDYVLLAPRWGVEAGAGGLLYGLGLRHAPAVSGESLRPEQAFQRRLGLPGQARLTGPFRQIL